MALPGTRCRHRLYSLTFAHCPPTSVLAELMHNEWVGRRHVVLD